MLKNMTLKDIIFLAILSVVLLLLSSLIMPIVMFTQITVLRQLFAAPIFAFFTVIALRKVPKLGAVTIVGFITGLVLLFMSPIMFFNNFIGAVISELLVFIIFRTYEKKSSIIFTATIYIPITIPISFISMILLKGKTLSEMMGSKFHMIGLPISVFILGFLAALLGMKTADELQKAGKLK